jgi:4-hydroxy-3-polyprenylbenzoate decarboxylase
MVVLTEFIKKLLKGFKTGNSVSVQESKKRITLAITGASGAPYALRLLEMLLKSKVEVFLLISRPARVVLATETDINLPSGNDNISRYFLEKYNNGEGKLHVLGREEWFSPIASGSNPVDAMIVCPCSMSTLSAIANGSSNNLMERAADVMLKEQRKLIIVPREAPFSAIHLEHMLKLAQLGITVMPATPAFYHKPQSIEDLVDFVVARILDHINIEHELVKKWSDSY